jgi:hypothetical protein
MNSAPHFVTVYEFSPYLVAGWPMFLIGFVIPTLVLLTGFRGWSTRTRLFGVVLAVLMFGVIGAVAVSSVGCHFETMSRIQNHQVSVVEGLISDAHCIGRGRQAFSVGAEKFEPSDVQPQPGFESGPAFSNSGVNGMHVRVHYVDEHFA